jgi:antitoxin (DNA-binding transcriptional repressor) of toxin-antitoxin stability system
LSYATSIHGGLSYVWKAKSRRLLSTWNVPYIGGMSEIPLDEAPSEVSVAAHDAAHGQVVYLTEHGQRLAAIVPAEIAAEMESMAPEAFLEMLEDFADAHAARQALAEGGAPVPWEQVKAEAEAQAKREAEAERQAQAEPEAEPEAEL